MHCMCKLVPVRPDDVIKSYQIFPNIARKVAKSFCMKVLLFKIDQKFTKIFVLLL